jgi:16S rRNA (uracil1498-N3)-methyltransferase
MHSFWGQREGDLLRLDAEELAHAVKSLRVETGDVIQVFDGSGDVYVGRVSQVHKKYVLAQHLETLRDYGAVSGHLHIAIAPTKNVDRIHFFLEKAVEMGIHEISPLVAFHSERRHWNEERALRIMKAACTQSRKGRLPLLHSPRTVESLIKEDAAASLACMATCMDSPQESWVELVRKNPERPVLLMIGPEGDFSAEELALAQAAGFHHVHLGEHRLRTETAGLYAVAAFAQR